MLLGTSHQPSSAERNGSSRARASVSFESSRDPAALSGTDRHAESATDHHARRSDRHAGRRCRSATDRHAARRRAKWIATLAEHGRRTDRHTRWSADAVAPSPGGGRGAAGGTADPCPRDHPARPRVKVETPSVNPGGLWVAAGRVAGPGPEGRTMSPDRPGPEGSRGAGGAPAGTRRLRVRSRSALDAGGCGPVFAGLPADRPNAAGCRVPAAPRPMLALGGRSPDGVG